jgi:hypothetical protein
MKSPMMMLCCATLLLVAAVPTAAAESSRAETLTLIGKKSAHIDVSIDSPLRVTCCHLRDSRTGRVIVDEMVSSVGGTYAGFAVERLSDRRVVVGALRVPEMDIEGWDIPFIATLVKGGVLVPGSYRIHLLADGPAKVQIEMEGMGRNVLLHPRESTPTTVQIHDGGLSSTAGASHVRLPIRVGSRSHVVLASQVTATGGQLFYLDQCVAFPSATCPTTEDEQDASVIPCPACLRGGGAVVDVYMPRDRLDGQTEAIFTTATAGALAEVKLLAFTFL